MRVSHATSVIRKVIMQPIVQIEETEIDKEETGITTGILMVEKQKGKGK